MPSLTTSPVVYGVCIGGCEFPREGGPASALTFAIELRLTEEGDTSCCGMDGTLRASMFTAERTSTAMRRRCSGSCCALNGPITPGAVAFEVAIDLVVTGTCAHGVEAVARENAICIGRTAEDLALIRSFEFIHGFK